MQEIGRFNLPIGVTPNNMEKYQSFTLGRNLRFIDSLQFLSSALSELVSNLAVEKLVYTKKEFGERVGVMARKGVYP